MNHDDEDIPKRDKIKSHLKENKLAYAVTISSVSCLGIGIIIGKWIYSLPTEMSQSVTPKQVMQMAYKCSQEMTNIIVQARGNPGDVVMRVSDGMTWASKNEMARDLDVARSVVSRYFAGDIPDIKGETFIDLGKAGHVLAVPTI